MKRIKAHGQAEKIVKVSVFNAEVIGNAGFFHSAGCREQRKGRNTGDQNDGCSHDQVGKPFEFPAENERYHIHAYMRVVRAPKATDPPATKTRVVVDKSSIPKIGLFRKYRHATATMVIPVKTTTAIAPETANSPANWLSRWSAQARRFRVCSRRFTGLSLLRQFPPQSRCPLFPAKRPQARGLSAASNFARSSSLKSMISRPASRAICMPRVVAAS